MKEVAFSEGLLTEEKVWRGFSSTGSGRYGGVGDRKLFFLPFLVGNYSGIWHLQRVLAKIRILALNTV